MTMGRIEPPFITKPAQALQEPRARVLADLLRKSNARFDLHNLSISGVLEIAGGSAVISGSAPVLGLEETDQSAPAAEWRWKMNSKSYDLEWAETAGYATWRNALHISRSGAGSGTDGTAKLTINEIVLGRSSSHSGYLGWAYGSYTEVEAASGELGIGGVPEGATAVAVYGRGTDPGGSTSTRYWKFVNRPLFVEKGIEGWGAQDFYITPNSNNAGTGRSFSLILRNTAGSAVTVLKATPNGANPQLGFFGVTPVALPSAYTQTYATADKTHATPTVGADIGAFTDPPTAAEMATLRTFVNALKADHADLAQLVNSVIDDLQALGLVA